VNSYNEAAKLQISCDQLSARGRGRLRSSCCKRRKLISHNKVRDSDLFGMSRHVHQISSTGRTAGVYLVYGTEQRKPCKSDAFLGLLSSKLGQF